MVHCCAYRGYVGDVDLPNRGWLVRDDVMAYKPNEVLWEPHDFQLAVRCRCKFHSDATGEDILVSTDWTRQDEGLGGDRWEVRATASNNYHCADHLGATDDRIITRAQWVNANPTAHFDFFPNI
jgi:hypothetical protein